MKIADKVSIWKNKPFDKETINKIIELEKNEDELIERFHSDLGMKPETLGRVRKMWDAVKDDLSWQGKKPSGIAGVIIYSCLLYTSPSPRD